MVLSSWISPSLEERNDKEYMVEWDQSRELLHGETYRNSNLFTRQLLSNMVENLPSWQRIQEPIWAMHDHSWLSTLDLPSFKSCTFVYKTAVSDGVNSLHIPSTETVPWKRKLWEPFLLKELLNSLLTTLNMGHQFSSKCSIPKFRDFDHVKGALSCYRFQLKGSKHDIKDLP